jgi:hypothetical protein
MPYAIFWHRKLSNNGNAFICRKQGEVDIFIKPLWSLDALLDETVTLNSHDVTYARSIRTEVFSWTCEIRDSLSHWHPEHIFSIKWFIHHCLSNDENRLLVMYIRTQHHQKTSATVYASPAAYNIIRHRMRRLLMKNLDDDKDVDNKEEEGNVE